MERFKSLVLSTLLIFCGVLAVASQSPTPNVQIKPQTTPTPRTSPTPVKEKDDEVIKVNTEIVTLAATVTDKNGRYRSDLKRGDFTVYENGTEQSWNISVPATAFR